MKRIKRRIERTKTILQFEAAECGAASLAIILFYYGRWVPLSELRVKMGVTRDGTNILQLRDTAVHYGLDVKARRYLPGAMDSLRFPLIAHWENSHFVVIEGFRNSQCYISDPSLGRYTTSIESFYRSTPTRIILEFEKASRFIAGGNPPDTVKSLARKLLLFRKEILYLILLSAISTVPTIGLAAVGSTLINSVLIQGQFDLVNGLIVLSIILFLVLVPASGFQYQLYRRLRLALSRFESVKFITHLLSLPIPFYESRYASELTHRVGLNDSIAQTIAGESGQSLIKLVSSLIYAILLLMVCWPLAISCFCIQALQIALLLGSRDDRNDDARLFSQAQGKLFSNTFDTLRSIETVKASSLEDKMFRIWAGLHARYTNSLQNISLTTSRINSATRLLNDMLTCTIIVAGGLLVIRGSLTIGWLISFRLIYTSFSNPLLTMATEWSKIEGLVGDTAKVDDALNEMPDKLSSIAEISEHQFSNKSQIVTAEAEQHMPQRIVEELQNSGDKGPGLNVDIGGVSFSYGAIEKPVLRNIDLTILEGQRVCLAGPTGCGKSTLLRIVAGIYQPTSGYVEIAGKNLGCIQPDFLHRNMAYVTQKSDLVDGTILENITLFDSRYSEEAVVEAATLAHIDRDISLLPDGYQTQIGGNEFRFSGGQRQRINIARAILRKPRLLLIDEATSALDAETERIVTDNISKMGCTQFVVAHRLNTIVHSDCIYYLSDGSILESGTHRQLMSAGGQYSQQYLQAS